MSDGFGQEVYDRTQPLREKEGGLARLLDSLGGLFAGKDYEPMYRWKDELEGGLDPSRPYAWGSSPDLEDQLGTMVRGGLDKANLDGRSVMELSEADLARFIDSLLNEIGAR